MRAVGDALQGVCAQRIGVHVLGCVGVSISVIGDSCIIEGADHVMRYALSCSYGYKSLHCGVYGCVQFELLQLLVMLGHFFLTANGGIAPMCIFLYSAIDLNACVSADVRLVTNAIITTRQ